MNENQTQFDLTVMSSEFYSGSSPFDSENDIPVNNYYQFLGDGAYIASYASLIFENFLSEKTGTQVNLDLAYTERSNYEYLDGNVLPLVMDQIFPAFVIIIYSLPYMYLLQRAVEEKQTKTRESMRMMGMLDSAYWTSWFILFFTQTLIISIIMTVGTVFSLFKGSNPILVFFMFLLYGLSIFGIALIMIAIFASVRTVAIGGIVILLIGYYLRYVFWKGAPLAFRAATALLPQLNLFHLNYPLFQLQQNKVISFSNINSMERNYSLLWFYIMSIVGFVFWLALGLYITYIVPTEFGTKRHPCFCLMPRRRRRNATDDEKRSLLLNDSELGTDEEVKTSLNFERVGNDLKTLETQDQCLKIENLSKVYSNGFKAVNHLSLKMYSGQIFALLGHNGAGKTTTISMLTGLFDSTSGAASAFGIDLLNDQDEARKIMGVCPQHNVLFPLLTTEEHFDIFCDFKGVPANQRSEAIEK